MQPKEDIAAGGVEDHFTDIAYMLRPQMTPDQLRCLHAENAKLKRELEETRTQRDRLIALIERIRKVISPFGRAPIPMDPGDNQPVSTTALAVGKTNELHTHLLGLNVFALREAKRISTELGYD